MKLQQLEYMAALDRFRNFARAAEQCYVTQPALTIQIKNLEDELGIKIFDRTKKPIVPTEAGKLIIEQARLILREIDAIKGIVESYKTDIAGKLSIGIIPTVAPYLVPRFINDFMKKYPNVEITFKEDITESIVKNLKDGLLDAGIVVTPIEDKNTAVIPVYYEEFMIYVSKNHPYYERTEIKPEELVLSDLWLLKEGNCFRNQVINICSYERQDLPENRFNYESFSIDSLRKVVENREGLTILPYLSAIDIPQSKKKMIKKFAGKSPVREISIIVNRSFMKRNLIEKLKESIFECLPESMKNPSHGKIIDPSV